MRLPLRVSALLGFALGLAPTIAQADSCAIPRDPPSHLVMAGAVGEYHSILRLCSGADGAHRVAIREMRLSGAPALLLADPETLATQLQSAACWTCHDIDESALKTTRMMRAVEKSAEAPELTKRGFLENAGLTHGDGDGAFLTGDLCPSTKPMDRDFIERLAGEGPHTPIALSISGLWLTHHYRDYLWLLEKQASGAIDILWTNHSYHHPFKRGVAFDRNFLLTPGVDSDAEILDTERLLIANGQTPSLLFRFPGLISNAELMQAARRHHLISLGADAWLALRQRPRPGSIMLVHPNGNEPAGLRLFYRDDAEGKIPKPLRALTEAPP
jgi:hypothetical protein